MKSFLKCSVILFFLFSFFPIHQSFAAQAGDIIITEIMVNPNSVSDTQGEWIELYNTTGNSINLAGFILSDNGSNSHLIENEIFIPANAYLVLGRNAEFAENGGLEVDYVYSSFTLANTEDEIILSQSGTVIDAVNYNSAWTIPVGASLSLIDLNSDNNLFENWSPALQSYGDGDLGTPGEVNFEPNNAPELWNIVPQIIPVGNERIIYVRGEDVDEDLLNYNLAVFQNDIEIELDSLGISFEEVMLGDLDFSGSVDLNDVNIFKQSIFSMRGQMRYNPYADLNSDGFINFLDFGTLRSNYLQNKIMRLIRWNPEITLIGNYIFEVEVEDGRGGSDLQNVSVIVE